MVKLSSTLINPGSLFHSAGLSLKKVSHSMSFEFELLAGSTELRIWAEIISGLTIGYAMKRFASVQQSCD